MKKYTSIENHYRNKHINFFIDKYPELKNEVFVVQEKIDGSNIRFSIEKDKDEIIMGSRNMIVPLYRKVGGHSTKEVLETPRMQEFLNWFKDFKYEFDYENVTIFGEFFGPGVMKRINYGDEKRILFFDIMIDHKYLSIEELEIVFVDFLDLLVPKIDIIKGLEKVLEFETEIQSRLSPTLDILEGVVIKPFFEVYTNDEGSPFYLKKKNEKFLEKTAKPKKEKDIHNVLDNRYIKYINENRVKSVFSKEGEISNPKEIGKFIKLVNKDALEDFKKDNPEIELEKWETQSAAKKIVEILKKYM